MWSAARSNPAGYGLLDPARLRAYRLLLYLAVAVLVLGTGPAPVPARVTTAAVYLPLGLLGILIQGLIPGGSRGRALLWPVVPALDVAAQGFVLARMGGPGSSYLLLLALPIFVWGLLRGIAGGIWAAGLALGVQGFLAASAASSNAAPLPTHLLHAAALLLLGLFAGLLGRRIQQVERLHRQTRRELETAQLDAASVVSQLSRGLLCLDEDGRVTLSNARAQSLLAPLLDLSGGGDLREVFQRSPQREALLPLIRHLLGRLSRPEEESHEILLSWAEGGLKRELPLEVATSPILDREGKLRGLLVLLSDQTARAALEADRRRKERLALIGELAAGLAHEIRNSLKPITGSIELLRRAAPGGENRRDSLMEIILRESESLENFVTEFLNFARDKNLENCLVPLERVLGEEWESLNSLPQSPFRLIRPDEDESRIWVRADRGALRQVVRNLGLNALEAGGGPIEIGWKREGAEAVIYLRDHGPGIAEQIRSQVFEPFFTTKPHGTGLGLAIARDLVDRLGGRLALEPAEGGGMRATIRLPLQAPPEGGLAALPEDGPAAARAA
jgi:signal transduction histidine kinase